MAALIDNNEIASRGASSVTFLAQQQKNQQTQDQQQLLLLTTLTKVMGTVSGASGASSSNNTSSGNTNGAASNESQLQAMEDLAAMLQELQVSNAQTGANKSKLDTEIGNSLVKDAGKEFDKTVKKVDKQEHKSGIEKIFNDVATGFEAVGAVIAGGLSLLGNPELAPVAILLASSIQFGGSSSSSALGLLTQGATDLCKTFMPTDVAKAMGSVLTMAAVGTATLGLGAAADIEYSTSTLVALGAQTTASSGLVTNVAAEAGATTTEQAWISFGTQMLASAVTFGCMYQIGSAASAAGNLGKGASSLLSGEKLAMLFKAQLYVNAAQAIPETGTSVTEFQQASITYDLAGIQKDQSYIQGAYKMNSSGAQSDQDALTNLLNADQQMMQSMSHVFDGQKAAVDILSHR